ncbi:MAG: hypothetical protein GY862_32375, partial [Gammaproteobacteria bacterium]|nr:hypothetical protein [Gammaproteobacteria bacterium]
MITGTAVIENTGESHSKILTVRVTEPGPQGELHIIPPTFSPSEVNPDAPVVEVAVRSSVIGTNNPPAVLTLEETDRDGLPIAVTGELNDDGVNGDFAAGDFIYTGIFAFAGDTEKRRFFRCSAVVDGTQAVSSVDFFTVTRFPIGLPPEPVVIDYLVEDPAGGAPIFPNRLKITFAEGVSPDRIEEIAAAEHGVILGTALRSGVFHLKIISNLTLELLWNIVDAFRAYPEVEAVDISRQNAQPHNAKAQAAHPDTGELYTVSRDDGRLYRAAGLTGDYTRSLDDSGFYYRTDGLSGDFTPVSAAA